jgi:hypothetical protein
MRKKNFSYTNKKGPRYLKQRLSNICGPIAMINLFKCLGLKLTGKDIPQMIRSCHCSRKNGTYSDSVRFLLKHTQVKHFSQCRATIKKIDKALSRNSIILLSTRHKGKSGEIYGHYSLVIKKTPKMYLLVNMIANETLTLFSRKHLEKVLSVSDPDSSHIEREAQMIEVRNG